MSVNTLIRALSPTPYSISDAAAHYPCHPVVRIIKAIFSLGLTEAYDHYYNFPSKRDAVLDLKDKLDNPRVSQVITEFEFEKQTYRVTDIQCHDEKSELIKNGDLRNTQEWLVVERQIKTEKGMEWIHVSLIEGSVEKLKARVHIHVQPTVDIYIPKSPVEMYKGL